jgi:hypothetical protein
MAALLWTTERERQLKRTGDANLMAREQILTQTSKGSVACMLINSKSALPE